MANNTAGFELIIFAQEALRYLRSRLGVAARVNRGFSPDPARRGSTIDVPIRSRFEAKDAPSDSQGLDTSDVQIKMDHWREVKFAVTDKEVSEAGDRLIRTHVEPAVDALAEDIETRLVSQHVNVPWAKDFDPAKVSTSIVEAREILADRKAPMTDGRLHAAVDHRLEALLLDADIFKNAGVTGGTANQGALMSGFLGARYGLNFFANGVIQKHTSGTVVSAGNDVLGALTAEAPKGATSIAVGSLNGTETIKIGDSFVIAGNDQRYVATADVTLAGGAGTVPCFPALVQTYPDSAVVTFEDGDVAGVHADSHSANLVFHEDWLALATAPLDRHEGSSLARRNGVEVETVTDPDTGLVLRAMAWYDPDAKETRMSFDILFGFKVLDSNLAVKLRRDV